MSTNPDILPPDRPTPRKGERAERIRRMFDRNPNMPQSVIAKRVGCDKSNVSTVLNRYLNGATPTDLSDFQSNKAEIYDAIQHRALSSITQETLANASFQQLVTGAAILEDKSRLVRGQPTSIHVSALLDVLDVIRERDESK